MDQSPSTAPIISFVLPDIMKNTDLDKLKAWIADAQETIQKASREKMQKVRLLTDARALTTYDPDAMQLLMGYMQHNAPFVERSAVIESPENVLIKAGTEVTAKIAQRDNIKLFKTPEEAKVWLES